MLQVEDVEFGVHLQILNHFDVLPLKMDRPEGQEQLDSGLGRGYFYSSANFWTFSVSKDVRAIRAGVILLGGYCL